MTRLETIRDRLVLAGASLATLDAFEAEARRLEGVTLATALRAAATDDRYDLHGDAPTLLRVADQVQAFRN